MPLETFENRLKSVPSQSYVYALSSIEMLSDKVDALSPPRTDDGEDVWLWNFNARKR